jgi:peptide/nickel transport system permease protein
VLIVIFSVELHWFPSLYDTTLKVTDWNSFLAQLRQMVLPVMVLALYNASQISRFMRPRCSTICGRITSAPPAPTA